MRCCASTPRAVPAFVATGAALEFAEGAVRKAHRHRRARPCGDRDRGRASPLAWVATRYLRRAQRERRPRRAGAPDEPVT